MQRRFLATAIAAFAVLALPALAQQADRLRLAGTPPVFQEAFTRKVLGSREPIPPASLRALAGLQLGEGQGRFDLDGVRIPVPRDPRMASFCVRVRTLDRRYSAENPYRLSSPGGASVGIESRSRYRLELADTYSAREMAILVASAEDCAGRASGPLIPAIPPNATSVDMLRAFVNAPGERMRAELADGDGRVIAAAACQQAAAGINLYSAICQLRIPARRRSDALTLRISGSGQAPALVYPVLLSASGR